MKRSQRIAEWAKLAHEKNGDPKLKGISFVDACNCGGTLHRWGDRPDNVRCPARRTSRQSDRVKALGALNGR